MTKRLISYSTNRTPMRPTPKVRGVSRRSNLWVGPSGIEEDEYRYDDGDDGDYDIDDDSDYWRRAGD